MGSLRVRVPKQDLPQVQGRVALLGLDANYVRETGTEVTIDVIGDGLKCLQSTAFTTVSRVSWHPVAKKTKDDHVRTIYRPRPRP